MNKHVERSSGSLLIRGCLGMLLLAAGSSLSACYVYTRPYHEVHYAEGGEVLAEQAPPPPQEEVVTIAPTPGLVWVGGYWGWYGGRYVWVSGGWHRPPRPGAAWVGGYWTARPGGGHVWVRGRWR